MAAVVVDIPPGPLQVHVEYCSSCGFHAEAIDLKKAFVQAFGNGVDVTMAAGRPTSFEVTAGGKLIYSKLETGDFPKHPHLVKVIGDMAVKAEGGVVETNVDSGQSKAVPPRTSAAAAAAINQKKPVDNSPYGTTFVGAKATSNRSTAVPAERSSWPLWLMFPLFYFPYVVDDTQGRVSACFVGALSIVVAVAYQHWWAQWIAAFLCADYLLRILYGGNASLLGTLGGWIAHFLPHRVYPGPPKQFAQMCGFMCTGGATIAFWTSGAGEAGQIAACVIMAALAALNLMEGLLGICMGCIMFKIAVNCGVFKVDPSAKCDLVAEEFDATWTWIKQRLNEGPVTPVIKYASADTVPLIYKVKTDDQRKEDQNFIKHVNFSYLLIPVSLVGLAACFRSAFLGLGDTNFGIVDSTWIGLTILAIVVFGLVLILLFLKLVLYPRKFWKDWDHPQHSNAIAGFSLCVAMFGYICNNVWSKSNFVPALFWISGSTQTFLTVVIVGRWIQRLYYKSQITPMYFMTPVSALVVAILCTIVPISSEFAYLWFATGIIFWIILLPMTLQRIMFGGLLPDEQRSSLFMYIACPSIACVAWLTITDNQESTGKMDPVALTLFFFGLFNVFLQGGLVITGYFGRNAFDIGYWAYSFPLEAFTLSAIEYYRRNDRSWTRFMAVASLLCISYHCAILGAHTVLAIIKRTGIFVPESKVKGPGGLGQLMHYAFRAALKDLKNMSAQLPRNLNEFAEGWAAYDLCHSEHARFEDDVIFPQFDEFFPEYSMHARQQHVTGEAKGEQMNQILKTMAPQAFAKVLQQARVPVPPELQNTSAAAPTADNQNGAFDVIRKLINEIEVHENEHMDHEEQQMQAIGRKFLNAKLAKAMWRNVWNTVPVSKWRVFVPFVIPEKMHLVGQMVYEGCDEMMWNRLSVDLPEMIPRHVDRHVHYY